MLFIALFLPSTGWTQETLKSAPDLAVGSMIASLLLVIVCILVFAFLIKKTNLLHNGRGKTLIKIIATQPLTNKGRVQIIEADGKRYLLGVTEQNINLIDTLSMPEDAEGETQLDSGSTPFATLLSKISTKRNE